MSRRALYIIFVLVFLVVVGILLGGMASNKCRALFQSLTDNLVFPLVCSFEVLLCLFVAVVLRNVLAEGRAEIRQRRERNREMLVMRDKEAKLYQDLKQIIKGTKARIRNLQDLLK